MFRAVLLNVLYGSGLRWNIVLVSVAWTGICASVGHILVEIPHILLVVLGLHLVLQNPFIVLFFGCLGGVLLASLGLRGPS